jgi:hypothetical protein
LTNQEYAELVTKGTSMTAEHKYGEGSKEAGEAPQVAADLSVSSLDDPLALPPEGASADDLEVFPHDRFLAALDGRMPIHEYALDALRHVVVPLRQRLN